MFFFFLFYIELRESFQQIFVKINKHQKSLQTAISVASYAVQLEQLENVLDATSAINHTDMKFVWRKKIGK